MTIPYVLYSQVAEKVNTFEELNLTRQFLNAIKDEGWDVPTDIQLKAIPRATDGHDILGIAQTGTGKSAAFLLPILSKIKYHQPKGPSAMVLAPTRELVLQLETMANTPQKDFSTVTKDMSTGTELYVNIEPSCTARA